MFIDRPTTLLGDIDRSSSILEIGPSISPMAPRSAGWNVTVVDHASQDELIAKYRNDPHANVANIEAVDYVWNGGPLHQAVPAELHGTFDVLIASHVIEHMPDPIGFLQSATRLLHPERGLVALAVPDKRWCFDYFKQVSTTGQMLEAHQRRAQRHSAATRFDSSAYVAFDGDRTTWGRGPVPNLYLPVPLEHALSEFQAWSDDPAAPYVDCHAWHFTPSSFRLNILELADTGFCDWHVSWLAPQPSVEFLVHLRPGAEHFMSAAHRDARRLELMKQIVAELREQAETQPLLDDAARNDLREAATQAASAHALMADAVPRLIDLIAAQQRETDQLRADLAVQSEQAALLLGLLRTRLDDAAAHDRSMAETAAMMRAALRPARAVWRRALPLRRVVARMRGRI
ncbi:MAG: methyltransferase domain-containing protein [Acetobacteraceae bacterium]